MLHLYWCDKSDLEILMFSVIWSYFTFVIICLSFYIFCYFSSKNVNYYHTNECTVDPQMGR